jgi:molybdenum cofactor cytidylyltransferase
MAAGDGKRFGGNKLDAMIDGKSLIAHALSQIPVQEFYKVVVVTQYPEIMEAAKKQGHIVCVNDKPEDGLSYTIKIGMCALTDAAALMFLVADQPLLTRQSVQNALMLYRRYPDKIVVMEHESTRGNPCIFPKVYFQELLSLTDDHGGRSVIEAHEDALLAYTVNDARELRDVDTRESLQAIKAR